MTTWATEHRIHLQEYLGHDERGSELLAEVE